MLAKINSSANIGLDGVIIDVKVNISSGDQKNISLFGLPKKTENKTLERVKSALQSSGINLPSKNITINLGPKDVITSSLRFDLPIAVGIMLAGGEFDVNINKSLFIGELKADGSVSHVAGILPAVQSGKKQGIRNIYIPKSNAREAAVISGVSIYPVESLKQLLNHLTNNLPILKQPPIDFLNIKIDSAEQLDMEEINGQEHTKRAMEVSAAGGHNLLIIGNNDSLKNILARTFPTILPSISEKESVETSKILSITNNIHPGQAIITSRPFRSPHHTIKQVSLIGGGAKLTPGEISLAHRGVLYLNDIFKFNKLSIEKLIKPLENGYVQISRASGAVTYPSKFSLIVSSNSCPCGNYLSVNNKCTCTPKRINSFHKNFSQPIMDCVDICSNISDSTTEKLTCTTRPETSTQIRNRVEKSRHRQLERYNNDQIITNSQLTSKLIQKYCQISDQARSLLTDATVKMGLTAKTHTKIIKISKTIADLSNCDTILPDHISESLQYRPINQG